MKKVALFVFNGDPLCFIHVLLNGLDMKEKGYDLKIIIEGSAVRLVPEVVKDDHALHQLWQRAVSQGLIEGVCKACAAKQGSLEAAEAQNLPILDEMMGHPGMATYRDLGYEVISF